MKRILAMLALAMLAAACATEPQEAPKVAPKACAPAPADLVVKDLEAGKGEAARFRSVVLVRYTGWLYDGCKADLKGAEFDSSKDRPPFGFVVGAGRVIKGWDQGVIGMKEGGKRLLVIPPQMAYGAQGAGAKIPPNSPLVFEVELVKILQQPSQ